MRGKVKVHSLFSSSCNHIWTEGGGMIAGVLIIYTQQSSKNGASGRKCITVGECTYAGWLLVGISNMFRWCEWK